MYDPLYIEEMEAELNARYDDLRERFGATAGDAARSWDDEPEYRPDTGGVLEAYDYGDGSDDIPF